MINNPVQVDHSHDLRDNESTMSVVTFTPFPDLPPEVRLMIWEKTWSEPRMIEPVLIKHPGPDGHTTTMNRPRPRCTLSS